MTTTTTTTTTAKAPVITPSETVSVLDQLDNMLAKELAPPKPAPAKSIPPPSSLGPSSPTPAELIEQNRRRTAIRLDQLERLLKTQEAELQRRDDELAQQQEELRALRQENREMHKFLADYGLQWVGGSAGSRAGSAAASSASTSSSTAATPPGTASARPKQEQSSAAAPSARSKPPQQQQQRPQHVAGADAAAAKAGEVGKVAVAGQNRADGRTKAWKGSAAPPDMEAVKRAVSELNGLAESSGGEIVRRRDGSHGFTTPSIQLTFWREGLQLDGGALRGYSEPEAVSFLRDLLDGYFPYELKHAFPEGVLFTLTDHSARPFGTAPAYDWGTGRRLDSRGDARVETLAERPTSDRRSAQPPADEDKSAVPAATALGGAAGGRAGQMLAGAALGGARMWQNPSAAAGDASDDGASGDADGKMGFLLGGGNGALVCGGAADGGSAAQSGGAQASRLQIKGPDGQTACTVSLPSTATLATVHATLLERGVVDAGSRYDLRTAFPSKSLTDANRTLSELGLVPSSTLCVRLL